VVLSEGPGNPMDNFVAVKEIEKLVGKLPIFAVGLGYQMLALALGAKTVKMKYGHRGGNQPVKFVKTGRVYVSSQNHGYEVVNESVNGGEVVFINVNDGGVEGIFYDNLQAVGVQFDPNSCSAAGETNFLLEKFIAYLK
jgi:carbamoyl-phosphate synthase small subunit